jgi:hypothetical protein
MPSQLLYATAHSAGNVSTPANALGAPDDVWTTDTLNASWTSRFAMGDPSTVTPSGTQPVLVTARINSSGGGTPQITEINLFSTSTLVRNLLASPVNVTATHSLEVTFDASEVANLNNVEIQIVTTGAGSGGSRRCVQLDAITWTATEPEAGVTGTLDATETGSDTLAATGAVEVAGTMAAAEDGSDTAAFEGTVEAASADWILAAGIWDDDGEWDDEALWIDEADAEEITGTLAATEAGSDTFAATGSVEVAGTLAATEEGSDTFATSGTVAITGTLAATEEGSDTFAATGTVVDGASGTLAATEEGSDTFEASGSVAITGTLAATEEGSDTFAASGTVAITGTFAATEEGSDTFEATGDVVSGTAGTLAAVETGSDTFAASGAVAISGTMAATETGSDTASITGSVLVAGSMAASEVGSDTFAASITVLDIALPVVNMRTITATVRKPTGEPWAGGVVRFRLLESIYGANAVVTAGDVHRRADASGEVALELAAVDSANVAYSCLLPNRREAFDFDLPPGSAPVALESLR